MPEIHMNYAIVECHILMNNGLVQMYRTVPASISYGRLFLCTDDLVKFVDKEISFRQRQQIDWVRNMANVCTMQWLDGQVTRSLRNYADWYPNSNPSEVLPRRFVTVHV